VAGRLARYEASMQELLYPETRVDKISRTMEDVGVNLVFPFTHQKIPIPIQLAIPKGTPVGLLGSLNIKKLVEDQLSRAESEIAGKSPTEAAVILKRRVQELAGTRESLLSTLSQYSTCADLVENKGHTFGAELSDHEKAALIQYMKNF
jgi:hypothetical protein